MVPPLFPIKGNSEQEREDEAWTKAKSVKKSNFALKYAIEETGWVVPRYIAEGLQWLAKNPHHKSEDSHE